MFFALPAFRNDLAIDLGTANTLISVSGRGLVISEPSIVMDDAIEDFVRRTYNLLIGERTAERVKIEIGSARPAGRHRVAEIKGRHQRTGLPGSAHVGQDEIRTALGTQRMLADLPLLRRVARA